MTLTPIVMTHADHALLRDLLERIPIQDRRHYRDFRRELARAERVSPREVPPDVVTLGSTVHLRELETDEPWTFTVCLPEEANIRESRISVLSPLGTAIIGCRVGDVVDWPVPAGTIRVEIENVVYQPEAAGVFNDPRPWRQTRELSV
jgi:regulator of nucleoside diphosphate kinase